MTNPNEVEKTEFTFPDEAATDVNVPEDKGVEIEVVDDTPAADRNRRPMLEAPADPSDDELASYSDSVKKRIQHFTKGYHEERRAKEASVRERDEAIRIAQALVGENQRLQGSLSQGQQTLLEQAKVSVAQEMVEAKRALKEAQESFDTDGIVDAQEKMMEVQLRNQQIKNYRPPPVQRPQSVVQPQQSQPQAPAADPKAQQWLSRNGWFETDEEMHGFAVGTHNRLVANGVSPTSDEYYEKLDARMREKFPESFDDGDAAPQGRKQSNVVASAKRSTAPKKIVLTQSQVSVAKRLGVPLEAYARQVAEEMRK